jgi:hypothetical protein
MRHYHGIRIGGALLAAVLMAASSLLMAAPALAQTKKALASVVLTGACCNAGPYSFLSGTVSAVVGSTPNTPSVYIRSDALRRTDTTSWTGPQTPYSKNWNDAHNAAVTFKRSHPLAPTAITTVNAYDKTNTAAAGKLYMPRYGLLRQTPGPNRFGGTMAIVSNLHTKGTVAAAVGWYDFTFNANATAMLTGPVSVGQYGIAITGMITHQTIMYPGGKSMIFDAPVIATLMPSTTGTQYLYQNKGYYVTTYTYAGYDNRTPNGLYGTLSLVRPMVLNYFWTSVEPPPFVAGGDSQGFMYRNTITFLPEPGSLLMLGCGILTLAGLYRLRLR